MKGDVAVNLSITLLSIFLFTLITVTCQYSTLTQLTYHFASYNSCSNWRPLISMHTWHRRTRLWRTLTNILDVFWISQAATILATNSMSVSTVFHGRWIGREALFHGLRGHLTWIPLIISMGISTFTCVWDPSRNGHGISYQNCSCLGFKTHQGYLSGCGRILYVDVIFALRLVAVYLSNCCKVQNSTLIVSMYCICR